MWIYLWMIDFEILPDSFDSMRWFDECWCLFDLKEHICFFRHWEGEGRSSRGQSSRGQQAETRQAEGASRLGCLVAGVGCRLLWVATAGQRLLQHATDLPELSNGTLLSRKQIV